VREFTPLRPARASPSTTAEEVVLMAQLNSKKRKRLKKSQFALPGRRYPVHDRAHAANAKARATQQYRKGKISKSTRDKVHARANKVLKRKKK
jgi:hypothetical protein